MRIIILADKRFLPPWCLLRRSIAATTTKRSLLPPVTDPCTTDFWIAYVLLTASPDARALVRLQADHVNRTPVPAFYRYIQAQDEGAR